MRHALLSALLLAASAWATAAPPPPADLAQRAGYAQRLGARVPLTVPFQAANGRAVTLAGVAQGKPVLLAFGYYHCPNLCDVVLHGIAKSVEDLSLRVGRDYQLVFVGIDPHETPSTVAARAQRLMRLYPAAHVERWHLLTGTTESVQTLAKAVGFRYFYDARNRQYAHAAGIVVLTGQGRVGQYFFGVDYPPRALRLALVDASRGRLGNLIDSLVLLCCNYDPTTGRYSLLIGRVMQAFGVGFVLLMLGGVLWQRRRTPP